MCEENAFILNLIIILNGSCLLDIHLQLTGEDFNLSICCSTCFSRKEGEGLQVYSTDPQHPCKTFTEFIENTSQDCKRFSEKCIHVFMKVPDGSTRN